MLSDLVLAELEKKVGEEIHVGPWLTMTQERINQFAEVTGDSQWIHVDRERAVRESPFGDTVAHGYLIQSLIPYLTEVVHPERPAYPGMKSLVNYGSNRVRFVHAVKAGMKIRARTELVKVEEVKGALQITRKVTIEIKDEEKPACVAETVARVYF